MALGLYLDTSAVLHATLETGTDAETEARIANADVLVTSRLSLVEAARALIRARATGRIHELQLADVQRRVDEVWARCHVWELTRSVCERAASVASTTPLRALDAIHLATFLEARRRLGPDLDLLTSDARLKSALDLP